MRHAAITGWGKCLPPAVLSNADLASFLDTSDEWVVSRTGIRERRVSHVLMEELAYVAASRALAAAAWMGATSSSSCSAPAATTTRSPTWPPASRRESEHAAAAAMDVNTACTSFSLRTVHGHGDDSHRCRSQRPGHRRGADLAVHGLERSQCRRAVRRRRRRSGAAGDRARGRRVGGATGLLRRSARNSARARHGRALRQPWHALRRHALAVRRAGNLQARGAGHGRRLRARTRQDRA